LMAAATNYRHREDTCYFPSVIASSVVSEFKRYARSIKTDQILDDRRQSATWPAQ
jgi:hypothetical protein